MGKICVIVEIIKFFKYYFQIFYFIFVCVYINVVVDNFLVGMVKYGVKVIRIGMVERVFIDLKQYILGIKMESYFMWIFVQIMIEKIKRFKDEIFRLDFGMFK